MTFRKVGVIGAGTIGTGVATDLALHGIQVVLIDIKNSIIQKAEAEITKNVRFAPLVVKYIRKEPFQKIMERIQFSTILRDVQSCEFIIENATENWNIKENIYRELDAICRPEVFFGVNTSCISITKIAHVTGRPERVVGIHFMNPVHMKSAVEVIKGFHTSEECLGAVNHLFAQLKKEAIIVNDYPGFVSNRISHLFMNEAAFVLQDQVASAEQVDMIFKKCYGHTMGPLETADLIGLDTVMHSIDVLYESYQDPKFRCCPLLRKLVYANHLGRKTGRGFYHYPES